MLKTKTKVKISLASISLATFAFLFVYCLPNSSAETCTSSPCNTTFQVNVKESLTVAITSDDGSESTGDIDEFLRNKINVKVITNNPDGFYAAMYPLNSSLVNAIDSTKTIPTWTTSQTYNCNGSSTCEGFPVNKWGYSLDDNASHTGTYSAMLGTSASPTLIFNSTSGTDNKDVYFGTKADITQASGTYLGTVVISAVSGSTAPSTPPSDPATPADDTPNDGVATYDSTNDRTVYTTTTTSGGSTVTTTQVSDGNNTSMYPLGETYRSGNTEVNTGSSLASGLAIAASVAAASGAFFFIMAKRREDDDEEESEE